MAILDLSRFGIDATVNIHGAVEDSWDEGRSLVILFGENHKDRKMKLLNVRDACALITAGVVGCVGTEVPLKDLDGMDEERIADISRELFDAHKTDEAVIDELGRKEPWWFWDCRFGNALRILRPALPVHCVEDPVLAEQMKPILDAYILWSFGAGPHPYPEKGGNSGDHPHNFKREEAMIGNLLDLWEKSSPNLAAILNTGSDHTRRIADSLKARGVNYFIIANPLSPDLWGLPASATGT